MAGSRVDARGPEVKTAGSKLVLPSEGQIEQLLASVRPPEDRLALAQQLPVALRAHLRKSKSLQTHAPHTRLGGSYARHVSTHQIKDVDIIVLLDASYRELGPSRALADLEAAAATFAHRRRPGAIDRRSQRRSVRVAFTSDDFFIDLVPALAPHGAEGTLEIPDRERGHWIQSASLGYGTAFSDLNRECTEKLVPMVLLVRHWALQHCADVRVKGFWLEALVVQLVRGGKISGWERPLLAITADAFDAMYTYCQSARRGQTVPVVADPILRTNVAGLWKKAEFNAFFDRLEVAHDAVARCRAAVDATEATVAWQALFGGDYLRQASGEIRPWHWAAGIGTAAAVIGAIVFWPRR